MLELYASTTVSPNLLILLGEQHADPNDVYAYYDVAETALNYGILKGCKMFVSCAVFRSRKAEDRVYVAATTSQEAEKLGDKPFPFGRIISQTGPLLGLAKVEGFRIISILGSIKGNQDDESLSDILLDRLIKVLDLTLVK
jgi:proteasome assembly chaperone (PAC2) family protein